MACASACFLQASQGQSPLGPCAEDDTSHFLPFAGLKYALKLEWSKGRRYSCKYIASTVPKKVASSSEALYCQVCH